MPRFRLTIEYDGRDYMGWQRQPHGPTIQQAIEEAIDTLFSQKVGVHAAGRTDAGVHAIAMVAHCDIDRAIEPYRLTAALNAKLRESGIAVLDCAEVAPDWHARFTCIGRHYVYRIVNRRAPLALETARSWHIVQPLDHQAMARAAIQLVGQHDFTTFRSIHCQSASAVKTLDRLTVTRNGQWIELAASARSFLHHQVRSMVGCLALVGLGRWEEGQIGEALAARDRHALGLNAPPDGLYFVRADYPD